MNYGYVPIYIRGNTLTNMYYGKCSFEDKDIDYVKEMYPQSFSKIRELVEEECNHQEFDGSIMYDQYPDGVSLIRIIDKIFNKTKECTKNKKDCPEYPKDNWLKDIIKVVLLHEMHARKQKRRKYY